MIRIDRDWLRAHPLPCIADGTDKNDRGRVLVVGGSAFVPGALRLTGEAALRAGAGKLQFATVWEAALALGIAVPEAAVIALPSDDDGEIAVDAGARLKDAIGSCDALVLGPAMSGSAECATLVAALLKTPTEANAVVLDAAAISACRECAAAVRALAGPVVLTPHAGEMASLTGHDAEWIAENGERVAREVASDLNAVMVLKGGQTIIAAPDGDPLLYEGGGPGLATGGSGDVLAGIVGGLLARGADPLVAAAWAVWVHGEAGRMLSVRYGGPGLLARELVGLVPGLLHAVENAVP